MGCSSLVVSKILASVARQFEIVEGSEKFASEARKYFGSNVIVHHALFEEFSPTKKYEAIVLTNTLHHLEEPRKVLMRVKKWLARAGTVYITVPNMLSLHRRIGVKMGLLSDVFATTERNIAFEQSGRYTKETLEELCISSGFHIKESFGFFLKPFSDEQMALLNPSDELIEALYKLGKEFEAIASLLYIEMEMVDEI